MKYTDRHRNFLQQINVVAKQDSFTNQLSFTKFGFKVWMNKDKPDSYSDIKHLMKVAKNCGVQAKFTIYKSGIKVVVE